MHFPLIFNLNSFKQITNDIKIPSNFIMFIRPKKVLVHKSIRVSYTVRQRTIGSPPKIDAYKKNIWKISSLPKTIFQNLTSVNP